MNSFNNLILGIVTANEWRTLLKKYTYLGKNIITTFLEILLIDNDSRYKSLTIAKELMLLIRIIRLNYKLGIAEVELLNYI